MTTPYGEFHDAGVSHFHLEKGELSIRLECYNDEKEGYDPVTFVFSGVKDSKISDEYTSSFKAAHDDGEILDFDILGKTVKILIEWHDFNNKTKSTKSYSFTFEKVDVTDKRNTRH